MICYNITMGVCSPNTKQNKTYQEIKMHYSYRTSGTCSSMIDFDIIDGKIHNIAYTGGCNGNLKAISSLLEGADVDFAIERLSGIHCGFKDTSCGDQLARALKKACNK
ncbi:MAG: TIGR03905 family TSCPD domain-containing protein [Christensenellales bacterium]